MAQEKFDTSEQLDPLLIEKFETIRDQLHGLLEAMHPWQKVLFIKSIRLALDSLLKRLLKRANKTIKQEPPAIKYIRSKNPDFESEMRKGFHPPLKSKELAKDLYSFSVKFSDRLLDERLERLKRANRQYPELQNPDTPPYCETFKHEEANVHRRVMHNLKIGIVNFLFYFEKKEKRPATAHDIFNYIKTGKIESIPNVGDKAKDFLCEFLIDKGLLPEDYHSLLHKSVDLRDPAMNKFLDQKVDIRYFMEAAESKTELVNLLKLLAEIDDCVKQRTPRATTRRSTTLTKILAKRLNTNHRITNRHLFLAYEYAPFYPISKTQLHRLETYLRKTGLLPDNPFSKIKPSGRAIFITQ